MSARQDKLRNVEKYLERIKPEFKDALNVVPGEGNSEAKIIFVGEAPGPQENKTGRPFVGRSGKFLDKLFTSIKLERKSVFITSIVKFYPGRRAPTKEEIEFCLPFTLNQIEIIKPKLIVLLGNVAIKSLLDEKFAASKIHGKIFEKNGVIFFPTFHPSAAMRFTKIRNLMIKDFKKLNQLIENLKKK